jgi:hypothetical protein
MSSTLAKIAELHERLAEAYRELASGDAPRADAPKPARPRRGVRPAAPLPDVEVTELDRARARRALLAVGYRVKP